jgi:hypothetical protein
MVGYKRNMCICIQKHVKASQDENIMRQKKIGEKIASILLVLASLKPLADLFTFTILVNNWCM